MDLPVFHSHSSTAIETPHFLAIDSRTSSSSSRAADNSAGLAPSTGKKISKTSLSGALLSAHTSAYGLVARKVRVRAHTKENCTFGLEAVTDSRASATQASVTGAPETERVLWKCAVTVGLGQAAMTNASAVACAARTKKLTVHHHGQGLVGAVPSPVC